MAKATQKTNVPAKAAEVSLEERRAAAGIATVTAEELALMQGAEDAGLSDNMEDRGTPLLYIAQKGSKQVSSRLPEYIPGLEVGMVFNNLTGQFWPAENPGLEIIPCFFRANYLEWTPIKQGGGFHGAHPRDTNLIRSAKPREGRRDIFDLPNGHELVLTHHYFCILPETMDAIIIPMASTNLGASQRLQALIGAQKFTHMGRVGVKPGFFNRYLLKTNFAQNDQGDWFKYSIELAGPNSDPVLLQLAKNLAVAAKGNAVKMAEPMQSGGGNFGDGGAPDAGEI